MLWIHRHFLQMGGAVTPCKKIGTAPFWLTRILSNCEPKLTTESYRTAQLLETGRSVAKGEVWLNRLVYELSIAREKQVKRLMFWKRRWLRVVGAYWPLISDNITFFKFGILKPNIDLDWVTTAACLPHYWIGCWSGKERCNKRQAFNVS